MKKIRIEMKNLFHNTSWRPDKGLDSKYLLSINMVEYGCTDLTKTHHSSQELNMLRKLDAFAVGAYNSPEVIEIIY